MTKQEVKQKIKPLCDSLKGFEDQFAVHLSITEEDCLDHDVDFSRNQPLVLTERSRNDTITVTIKLTHHAQNDSRGQAHAPGACSAAPHCTE